MMRATATVVNPDSFDVAITITMPIGQWRKIREALEERDYWPCGKLGDLIRSVVQKIETQVYINESDLT